MFLLTQLCLTLQLHGLELTRLLCPWESPGKNTGVGCHFLLQGIFPTQGSNPGLPHSRQMLYHLRHQGIPIYTSLPYREIYIVFLFPHLSPSTQILFKIRLAHLLASCVFILFFFWFLFSSFFFCFFLKFCKSDNTFTGDLEKHEAKLHIVPLYITMSFLVGKLRFFAGVLISSFQKLIEWVSRKVEGYLVGLKSTMNQFSINEMYIILTVGWKFHSSCHRLYKLGDTGTYKDSHFNIQIFRFPGSPVVALCASNAGDSSLIPGWVTRIPHASWCSQRNEEINTNANFYYMGEFMIML